MFRNAHRLSWDATDSTTFAADIGMNHIAEINIVKAGGNYGWVPREGYFEDGTTRPDGAVNQLFPCHPTSRTASGPTASSIRSRSTTTATARR